MSGIRAGPTSEVFPRHSFDCVHIRGAARAAAHYIQVVLSGRGLFFLRASDDAFGAIRPQLHRIMCNHLQYRLTNTNTHDHTLQADTQPTSRLAFIAHIHAATHTQPHPHCLGHSIILLLVIILFLLLSLSSAHEFRMFVVKSAFVHFRFPHNEVFFLGGGVSCAVR